MRGFLCLSFLVVLLTAEVHSSVRKVRGFSFRLPWLSSSDDDSKSSNHVIFRLYTRDRINDPEIVDSREMAPFKDFKPGKGVVMFIHGWKGWKNCTFNQHVRETVFPEYDINLISVDWSGYGSRTPLYPLARYNVKDVAGVVAEFLDLLVDAGLFKLEDIHVMGHSLGAHVAGLAGRRVKSGKIGWITGLDPAGPLFSTKDEDDRLSVKSADFVDVIHTTSNFLAIGDPIGHVDFYPNGGTAVQPGCGLDLIGKCSHRVAYLLYLESITNPIAFPATKCKDWDEFRENKCEDEPIIFMGPNVPKTARGVYYFQTNSEAPYGKNLLGLEYAV